MPPPEPSFYPEASVPKLKDSNRKIMAKILGAQGGVPRIKDSKRRLLRKASLEPTEYGTN